MTCEVCNGTGERIVECNNHDVVYKEPCYCLLWEERLKEELAIKISETLVSKITKERLALSLASLIVEKHSDNEESVRALENSVENGNAQYLINWALL
tara:strand:- start:3767 stop:4060 length:294 start_codon:yes stop_codon:yes gene_type:complete